MYTYNVLVERVVDGDTVDINIDLGFKIWSKQRVRLAGIDTAETSTPLGKATKALLKGALEGKLVRMRFDKPDKYGRYLAAVWITSDLSVNDQLVVLGAAKPYSGESKAQLWTPQELAVDTIVGLLS